MRLDTRFLFLNVGHAVDHLMMLLFPAVVAVMATQFDGGYEDLALATGGFIAFGACACRPVGLRTGGAGKAGRDLLPRDRDDILTGAAGTPCKSVSGYWPSASPRLSPGGHRHGQPGRGAPASVSASTVSGNMGRVLLP